MTFSGELVGEQLSEPLKGVLIGGAGGGDRDRLTGLCPGSP